MSDLRNRDEEPEVVSRRFVSVTPIFGIALVPEGSELSMVGSLDGASYKISIRRIPQGDHFFSRLLEMGEPPLAMFFADGIGFGTAEVFAVVEVDCQASAVASNSVQTAKLDSALRRAINIQVPYPITLRQSFHFSQPAPTYTGPVSVSSPRVLPCLSVLWGRRTFFHASAFESLKANVRRFLERDWEDTMFGKVFDLAEDYYLLSKGGGRVEHAFLLLMVAFETLFSRSSQEGLTEAASRFGKLVANTQKDLKALRKRVTPKPQSYGFLRNGVAHGDPDIDQNEVGQGLLDLAKDVRVSLLRLMETFGGRSKSELKDDYYDMLDQHVESRFIALARR